MTLRVTVLEGTTRRRELLTGPEHQPRGSKRRGPRCRAKGHAASDRMEARASLGKARRRGAGQGVRRERRGGPSPGASLAAPPTRRRGLGLPLLVGEGTGLLAGRCGQRAGHSGSALTGSPLPARQPRDAAASAGDAGLGRSSRLGGSGSPGSRPGARSRSQGPGHGPEGRRACLGRTPCAVGHRPASLSLTVTRFRLFLGQRPQTGNGSAGEEPNRPEGPRGTCWASERPGPCVSPSR